jgi:hypothetical protein
MIGAVSSGHDGYGNACRSMISTWNEAAGIHVLLACAIPFPLSWSVKLQRENGDSGAESVSGAAVYELDNLLDVCRVTKSTNIEHLKDVCYSFISISF